MQHSSNYVVLYDWKYKKSYNYLAEISMVVWFGMAKLHLELNFSVFLR